MKKKERGFLNGEVWGFAYSPRIDMPRLKKRLENCGKSSLIGLEKINRRMLKLLA